MALNLVTCPLMRLVLAVIVTSFAFAEETSVTVNAESFLEIVTKKIAGLDSKVDSVLRACGNEHNGKVVDPKAENRICSMSSRIIEMENEIDGLKSSATVPSSDGWSSSDRKVVNSISDLHSKVAGLQSSFENQKLRIMELERRFQNPNKTASFISVESEAKLDRQVVDMISNFESKMVALQSSFETQKLRTIELEQRVHELNDTASSASVKNKTELGNNTCKFKTLEESYLVSHLLKVNPNIFLKKPSIASSVYNDDATHKLANALDGDSNSYYHSKKESNPWFLVELKGLYFIWEIQVTIYDAPRATGTTVYLLHNVTFLEQGKIDVNPVQMFGQRVESSDSNALVFKKADGMCGRYVVLYRAVSNEYLIIKEIQGNGYLLE